MHLSKLKIKSLLFTMVLVVVALSYDLIRNKFPDGYKVGYEEGVNKRISIEKQFGISLDNPTFMKKFEDEGYDIKKIKDTENSSYFTGFQVGTLHGLFKYEKKY